MPTEHFSAIFGLGPAELIIILVILILLFGAKKLPELARSIGKSANELKTSMNEGKQDKTKSAGKDVDSQNK